MEYRSLGKTDIKVSVICLGTMTFGVQNTEQDGHEQLDYAVANGVNFIDTAEMYPVPTSGDTQGETERIIGTWLKKRGKRDDIILASKIAGPIPKLTYMRQPMDFSKKSIHQAVNDSLKRLQTDYIDLYQLHWPERRTNFFGQLSYRHSKSDPWTENFQEVLEGLQEVIQAGKVRHVGLSNETSWGTMKFIQTAEQFNLPRMVSVQNPYSLLNRAFDVNMAEVAIREQVGLLAYSPLAFGLLSGKYHQDVKPSKGRLTLFGDRMSRYSGDHNYKAVAEYIKIAKDHNLSLTQMALAFINQQQFLTSNIIGATTMEQLKENIGSAAITLSKECMQAIEAIHKVYTIPAP